MNRRHDYALQRALRLDRRLRVSFEDGRYIVTWRRYYQSYLASINSVTGDSTAEALEKMADQEEDFRLLREHGYTCPCEDCCNARIDRSRR
jgi:hypothetical protein